jgi:hypothetical protein
MLGLAALFCGIFALIGSVAVASLTMALLFAFLAPLLIFSLFLRVGFALLRFGVALMLICFVAVWMI